MISVPKVVRSAYSAWRGSATRHTQWWTTWALLFAVIALWSISGPLFSGPDEPSHVVKAAAIVRGQLIGVDRQVRFVHDNAPPRTATVVRVPAIFSESHRLPACYAFKPKVPAGCSGAFTGSGATADAPTFAGHYPPVYYAIVGLPTLLLASAKGVFVMRFVGAAVSAALLASALASASESRQPSVLIIGVALAMTPMVLYTASVVNPSALEIPAALCVWVSTLVLVADRDRAHAGRLVARIGVSGALLVLSRGLSPLWLLIIATVTLATARRTTLARLARRRDVRVCAVGLVAATGLAAAWLLLAGTLDTREAPRPANPSVTATVRASLGDTDTDLRGMIGRFGWLDIEVPALARYLWLGAVGAVVFGAFTVGRRRYVVALALLLIAVVVLPVVLETLEAPKLGLFWSGRYTLPLAVGVPPLAAVALAERVRQPSQILSRLTAVVLGTLALGNVLAYAAATRRYAVGTSGPVMYVLSGDAWQPPAPAWALLAGFVVAAAALATWLHRMALQPAELDVRPSAQPGGRLRDQERRTPAV